MDGPQYKRIAFILDYRRWIIQDTARCYDYMVNQDLDDRMVMFNQPINTAGKREIVVLGLEFKVI